MQNKKGDSKLIFYHETGENVLKELGSNASYGLTDEQVLQRKQQYGGNRLRKKKKKTNLQRFLDQFKDVMILDFNWCRSDFFCHSLHRNGAKRIF